MNTPVRRGITICVEVTPPGTPQSMSTFLTEEFPAAIKKKTSLEIPPLLLERAFVDPPAYPGESVQEYAKRRDVAKVNVHIPDVLSNVASEIKRVATNHSLLATTAYELHAANMLSDFIQKATSMKGTQIDGKTGEKTEAAGSAEGVFLTSDRLRSAADCITANDLQGWGLDAGKYSNLTGEACLYLTLLSLDIQT